MATYTDENGKVITLGKQIAQGGEGTVYNCSTSSRLVAKIYRKDKLSKKKGEKLEAMCSLYDQEIANFSAWVKKVIYENGKPVGFLMEKITQYKEIHLLYGTNADRQKYFPNAEWKFMVHAALNLAIAVDTLHERGIVIGDINQSNILVNDKAEIKLIDCDSYQVEHNGKRFICEVGVPEYTSPELQGCSFKKVVRNQNHDYFGLAVMIFKILFFAKHPYSGCNAPSEIENAITGNYFCYARNYAYDTPIYSALVKTLLNDKLKDLFERAFCDSTSRPTAKEWISALEEFEKNDITVCSGDNIHFFNKNSNKCIWCALKQNGLDYFEQAPAQNNTTSKSKTTSTNKTKSTTTTTNQSNTITCSNCGYTYQNINNTCPVCGYSPNFVNNNYGTNTNAVNQIVQNSPQNTRDTKLKALAVLIFCIYIIGLIIFSGSNHENNYPENYNNTNNVQNNVTKNADNNANHEKEQNKYKESKVQQKSQGTVYQEPTYEEKKEEIKRIDREGLKDELRGYQIRVTDSLNKNLGNLDNINTDFSMDVTITGFGKIYSCKSATENISEGLENKICTFLGDNLLGGPRVFAGQDHIKMQYIYTNGRFSVKALSYRRDYGDYVDNITVQKPQPVVKHTKKTQTSISASPKTSKLNTTTNLNNTSNTQKNERENWVDDYDVDFSKNPKSFTSLNNKVRLTPMPEKTTTRRTKINVEKEVKENDAYLFE